MAKALGVVALLLAVVALAINFAIPGPAGAAGAPGANGQNGTNGQDGADGLNCWDLNGNGVPDVATEDRNGDTVVNVNDCTGTQGPQGPQGPGGADGLNCWDLNGNGVPDVATEDLNGDTFVNVRDCTGPTGPAGPGSLVASVISTPWQMGGLPISGCTNVHSVSLTVPSAGTVVVTSTAHLWIDHTSGTQDGWDIVNAISSTDCSLADPSRIQNLFTMPSNVATGFYDMTGSVVSAFSVGAAGTYSYYLNVMMTSGASASDSVSEAATVAVFYPA